ncbi:hypothetical protein E2P81_ATG02857 [Venturia nashicola]|uniref:Uncharacterized protein n=1 Tax=Venturia nashicola TaxID=86259 RepID=A0A4Z1P6H3_9PEZI|nr:hypothetical protein E6O75_ATG02918 [Venturia nashicola]TLD37075.1 hypothetical protein E2P81_ATG02857 [Venturia nashicola]
MTPSPLPLHSPASPSHESVKPILRQSEKLHHEESQSPYNEAFENDLTHTLLHLDSPRQRQDLRVMRDGEGPLPLTSQERRFEVSIPARSISAIDSTPIKTTHPHGSIFGGENPHFPLPDNLSQNELREQVLDRATAFVKEAGITSRKQFVEILEKQMEELMKQVEARSRGREAAVKHNERVEDEKRVLEEENEMIRKGVMRNMGR